MINAVICEFNPFHNGHKYLLETALSKTGADGTVCFMSGDFVQRGEIAVCEKHMRAAAAVRGGADLVFQIPTAHTLASASVFARSGVYMASALGVPANLCFGTECEDMTPLYRLALIDKEKLAKAFRAAQTDGKSYAASVMQAYEMCGARDTDILKEPNNLLAFEYIKAVIELESELRLVNIVRKGAGHDSAETNGHFASASFIRENADLDISRYVPEAFTPEIDKNKFETALMFSILGKTAKELSRFADMCEGLENRFEKAVQSARTPDELYSLVKCKRYTHSRIRRAAINVLIGNPAGLYKTDTPYLKVLAFNDKGRAMLKRFAKTSRLPIIIKPSEARGIGGAHFELECRAADVYDFCSKIRHGGGREYRLSPVYVKGEKE